MNLGDELMEKMGKAIPRAITHYRAFRSFTEGLATEHKALLKRWELDVQAWENDGSQSCPYDVPEPRTSSFVIY